MRRALAKNKEINIVSGVREREEIGKTLEVDAVVYTSSIQCEQRIHTVHYSARSKKKIKGNEIENEKWCKANAKTFRLKTKRTNAMVQQQSTTTGYGNEHCLSSAKMEGNMKKFLPLFCRMNMKIFMVFCALFGTRTWIEKLNSYHYEFGRAHTCQQWQKKVLYSITMITLFVGSLTHAHSPPSNI